MEGGSDGGGALDDRGGGAVRVGNGPRGGGGRLSSCLARGAAMCQPHSEGRLGTQVDWEPRRTIRGGA